MIDATAYLAMQELAFRGHDEGSTSDNKGNYVELCQLMARYDHLLGEHLDSASVFTGMSRKNQNDLILAIATSLQNRTTEQIDKAPFYFWQIDETTDISCHSHNTIGQDRLKSLAIISIEKRLLKSLQQSPEWHE